MTEQIIIYKTEDNSVIATININTEELLALPTYEQGYYIFTTFNSKWFFYMKPLTYSTATFYSRGYEEHYVDLTTAPIVKDILNITEDVLNSEIIELLPNELLNIINFGWFEYFPNTLVTLDNYEIIQPFYVVGINGKIHGSYLNNVNGNYINDVYYNSTSITEINITSEYQSIITIPDVNEYITIAINGSLITDIANEGKLSVILIELPNSKESCGNIDIKTGNALFCSQFLIPPHSPGDVKVKFYDIPEGSNFALPAQINLKYYCS